MIGKLPEKGIDLFRMSHVHRVDGSERIERHAMLLQQPDSMHLPMVGCEHDDRIVKHFRIGDMRPRIDDRPGRGGHVGACVVLFEGSAEFGEQLPGLELVTFRVFGEVMFLIGGDEQDVVVPILVGIAHRFRRRAHAFGFRRTTRQQRQRRRRENRSGNSVSFSHIALNVQCVII